MFGWLEAILTTTFNNSHKNTGKTLEFHQPTGILITFNRICKKNWMKITKINWHWTQRRYLIICNYAWTGKKSKTYSQLNSNSIVELFSLQLNMRKYSIICVIKVIWLVDKNRICIRLLHSFHNKQSKWASNGLNSSVFCCCCCFCCRRCCFCLHRRSHYKLPFSIVTCCVQNMYRRLIKIALYIRIFLLCNVSHCNRICKNRQKRCEREKHTKKGRQRADKIELHFCQCVTLGSLRKQDKSEASVILWWCDALFRLRFFEPFVA